MRLYFDRLELHLGFYLCGPLSGESEYVILINYKSSSKFLLCSMPSAVLLQTIDIKDTIRLGSSTKFSVVYIPNNALNLDEDISGKPCNLYSRSCRLVVSKELLIDKIDSGEVVHRFEEYLLGERWSVFADDSKNDTELTVVLMTFPSSEPPASTTALRLVSA